MPAQYTPVPTNYAQITLVSDGDARNAASVDLPMSQLADKIEWTRRGSTIAPATLSGTQNNYTSTGFGDATVVRLDPNGGAPVVNGLDASGSVKLKLLVNVATSGTVTLAHMAGGQTAGNQLYCPSITNCVLGPADSAYVFHDATSGYWRVITCGRAAAYTWDGTHIFNQNPILGAASELNYFSPRARITKVPLTHTAATAASPWYWALGFAFLSSSGNDQLGAMRIPIRLPTGAVLKSAIAGVRNVNSGDNISMYIYKHKHNVLSDGLGSRVQLGTTASSSGATTLSPITSGNFAETILNADTDYYAEFHSSLTAYQELHWLAVIWDDLGPRSY